MHVPALSPIPPTPLNERELQTQIQQALNKNFTGQIHISFLNDRTETIFASEGVARQVYIHNHRVPDLNWGNPLMRFGRGTFTLKPMPARGMMFRKITLEEATPYQLRRSGTNQLKTMFSMAEQNNHPTLFQIEWDHAEGFALVAGKGVPIRRAVLLTEAGAEEGPLTLNQLSAWDEPQCNVSVHRGDIKQQAWLEVHLNILFEWYCQIILNQYAQLTGHVVVRSIMQNVLGLAARKGWDVSMRESQICATTILPTAAYTGDVYREILAFIRSQTEPVIGNALTRNLFRQAKDATREVYRIVEDAFGLIEEAA